MSDSNTLRVLSLDGGGMRGYISATFLKLFVQLWGINPNEIWKYFDIITGSSIGGLQALAYALGMSPTELQSFFTIDGPWIFTTSSSSPSVTPSTLTKINTIVGGPFSNPTFYPSTTAGIGTMRLKSKLDSVFGTNTLSDMKTKVLITSFEKNDANPDFSQNTNTPIYFSNSTIIPIFTGQNNLAVDVAMATSAAPLYFPAWNIGNDSYIDGGVVQNNPSSFSLAVAQAIKPTANRYCVLSIGTGLGDIGFPSPSNTLIQKAKAELIELKESPKLYADKWQLSSKQMNSLKNIDNLGILEGANLIMYLIGAMGGGPQEITAKELEIRAKYTLSNLFNYRMQYYLDPVRDTELDNSTPEILQYYEASVTQYFNNDIANISNFIGHLTA
jgi:predicted patatin/cPLA2 family phospholipase